MPSDTELPVQIWRINECDWVAGRTLDECIAEHARFIGWNLNDNRERENYVDRPRLVTDKGLASLEFRDDHGTPLRSFYHELRRRIDEGQSFPQFFATSNP